MKLLTKIILVTLMFFILFSIVSADGIISEGLVVVDAAPASICKPFKTKIDFYKKLTKKKAYTGDFDDVIEQYQELYDKCLKKPSIKKMKRTYRSPSSVSAQSTESGYLF